MLEIGLALTVGTPTVEQLPERIAVCGRDYWRGAIGSQDLLTVDGIRASGITPVIVLPLRIQPCVEGACTRSAGSGPCATVVFVRVGGDRYAGYSLSGGP